jgi:hypothetical protein
MSQKTHVSFRIKPEVAAALEAAAIADRRPLSQFVSNLIEDALAAKQPPAPERSAA